MCFSIPQTHESLCEGCFPAQTTILRFLYTREGVSPENPGVSSNVTCSERPLGTWLAKAALPRHSSHRFIPTALTPSELTVFICSLSALLFPLESQLLENRDNTAFVQRSVPKTRTQSRRVCSLKLCRTNEGPLGLSEMVNFKKSVRRTVVARGRGIRCGE